MRLAVLLLLEIATLALLAVYGGIWGFAFWLALSCAVLLTQKWLALRAIEIQDRRVARRERRRKRKTRTT